MTEKIRIARDIIRNEILEKDPPEKNVARLLYLYGITEQDFVDMRYKLNILYASPTFFRIQSYLKDEWSIDEKE